MVNNRKDVFIDMIKKRIRAISIAAAAVLTLGALPLSASAQQDDTVYVTMNIPYDDFYSSEVTNNPIEIDAVSSATDAKWKKFGVTYYKDNTDGVGGTIYGVSFPVAVNSGDLNNLKSVSDETDDYYYTELSEKPAVYKDLTINSDGSYSFSLTQGNKETTIVDACSLTSETPWGDYLFEFDDQNIISGDVYGIVVTTSDGFEYGMRHLENIWLKNYEFSWSSGFKTTEPHGNTLNPEHYKSIMGKTIKNVEYITTTGIYDYNVDKYVPIITGSAVTVADTSIDAGQTTVEITPELPDDFNAAYNVNGLNVEYADGKLLFSGANAGSYTLYVEDIDGKYAPISASFVLSTDKAAAKYDSASISLVSLGDDDAYTAFLKNISTVIVDGTSYSASGKRGIKIVNTENGAIDLDAESRNGKVFDTENKDCFEVTVSAAGYPEISFTLSLKDDSADDTSSSVSSNTSSVTSSETSSMTSSVTSSETSSKTSSGYSSTSSYITSPKTSGQSNAYIFVIIASLAFAAMGFSFRKSSKE